LRLLADTGKRQRLREAQNSWIFKILKGAGEIWRPEKWSG